MMDLDKILWHNTLSLGCVAGRLDAFLRKQKMINTQHACLILILTLLYAKSEIRISKLEKEIQKKDI